MSKAQRRWGIVEKMLTKTGETVQAREMMYKEVVQAVILYGRVLTDEMPTVLKGLCQQVDPMIAGMSDRQVGEKEWECSLVE